MEDPLLHKLEVFNEVTQICALSLTYCFSDLVPSNNKDIAGIVFDVVLVGNIVTHMGFIVKITFNDLMEHCRRKKIKTLNMKEMQKEARQFKKSRKERKINLKQIIQLQNLEGMHEFEKNRQATQVLRTQNLVLREIEERNETEESIKLSVIAELPSELEASESVRTPHNQQVVLSSGNEGLSVLGVRERANEIEEFKQSMPDVPRYQSPIS